MNTELSALIKLLEDPDPEVYYNLKPAILSFGIAAVDDLENACQTAGSKDHWFRIDQIISELFFRDIKERLGEWINSEAADLLSGINIVTELINPDIHSPNHVSPITAFRNEIWLELNSRLTALEKARVINYFFYEKFNFHIEIRNPDHPMRFSLAGLATDKLGNEVSLFAAYAVISRSLGLPIYGVNIPGISLLAYLDLPFTPKPGFDPSNTPILFFIHPGDKGRIFGIDEVRFFLSKFYPDIVSQPVLACSDSLLVKHFTRALAKSCKKVGKTDIAKKAEDLLKLW